MRRAISRIALFAFAITLAAPFAGAAGDDVIDGSLMVDYSKAPNFKVGSWVRYHGTANSKLGINKDYVLTLLVAGEEDVWGDRCFWLETWTENQGRPINTTASLISYTAFGDTAALRHGTWFIRKMVTGPAGRPGEPEFSLWTRDREEVRRGEDAIKKLDPGLVRGTTFDTLGVDTAQVPRGSYRGKVVRERSTITLETNRGDSTTRDVRVETRMRKMSDQIPITRMVREDVLDTQVRRGWLTGHSGDVKEDLLEEGKMRTMVIEYGSGGLKPMVIPPRLQGTIEQQQARNKKAAPPSRTSTTTKGG
jgi:hypothetical protein